ncbi:MAG: FtsX-like permease family protein [Rhodanobacter sp.]
MTFPALELRPILASLGKHRIPAILIVLEIALACAVLCNAVFMINQRVADIHLPNAMDEQGISIVQVSGTDPKLAVNDIPRDMTLLRSIPGVSAVAAMNTLPLSSNDWSTSLSTTPDAQISAQSSLGVSEYLMTRGGEQALGLRLLRGRWFSDGEYASSELGDSFMPSAHVIILTDSLAQRMWPGEPALGKRAYVDKLSYTVVGVVADVLRPQRHMDGNAGFYYCAFFPLSVGKGLGYYVVRSAPQDRGHIVRDAVQGLSKLAPNAVVKGQTFSEVRAKYFADTASMAWMLVLVCVVMLAVTAFGIVGLTSFWVGQRRRQIGIRRAVGATRGQIMQYFQTENFLLTTAGVVLGMALAYGINLYLMQHYEMSRMAWYYLPGSALALWLLGQLAVLGPALRAAAVPPVVATRSV